MPDFAAFFGDGVDGLDVFEEAVRLEAVGLELGLGVVGDGDVFIAAALRLSHHFFNGV